MTWAAIQAASEAKRKTCLVPFTDEEWNLWDMNGEEEYTVPLIKKYLRTEQHRVMLNALDISIEDALNGRVEGQEKQEFVHALFECWNQKLGYKHFG
jgi:hypothetical protein